MELVGKTDPLVPFALDPRSEDALTDHNRMMLLGYCLMLASKDGDSVSILGWGGALGHLYYVARALLAPDVGIDFTCKDVPLVVEYGVKHVSEIVFCDDDTCLKRRYDMVVAHASLCYSEEWEEVFARLAEALNRYLLI